MSGPGHGGNFLTLCEIDSCIDLSQVFNLSAPHRELTMIYFCESTLQF